MTNTKPIPFASSAASCPDGAFESLEQSSRAYQDRRLEMAGRRMAAYLRHLPLPENRRHELALLALHQLAADPGNNPDQAVARGMAILHTFLQEPITMQIIDSPGLKRRHMKPEEMDRRPWVRGLMKIWRPIWVGIANLFNSSYLDIIIYALLLGGLYALFRYLQH